MPFSCVHRLGEVIYDAVAFTTVSLFLRIMSAIAGAALTTSKYAISMEEFPDELTTAVVGNNNDEHVLLITMLTIKILSTINSLKKTIPSRHYLQFLSFKRKKKHLVLIKKKFI